MTRRFTGWHMTTVLVTFFAIVIGVNLIMARYAISTFGGTVVENSYVASQRYNGWLESARAQQALGWKPLFRLDETRHVLVSVAGPNGPLEGIRLRATATHPLGRLPSQTLEFSGQDGIQRSLAALPAGRWLIHLDVEQGQRRAAFDDQIGS